MSQDYLFSIKICFSKSQLLHSYHVTSMLISQNEGCAGGSLGFGFWLCRVSASVHWVFGVLVSILHNWGVLWGVGTGVLGIRSVGAGMWAGQRFGTGVFICTPFNLTSTKYENWLTFQA